MTSRELKPYCVISPNVDAAGVVRTWKTTEEGAVAHAQRLIENSFDRGNRKTTRLFVVKVVKVVEVPSVVNINVRDPSSIDTTKDVEEDE